MEGVKREPRKSCNHWMEANGQIILKEEEVITYFLCRTADKNLVLKDLTFFFLSVSVVFSSL